MAIRFPRVLIACGLPTILAIVSYYWLRKRRKAVVLSSSPQHLSETHTPSAVEHSEEDLLLSADSLYSTPKQSSQEVFSAPAHPHIHTNSAKVTLDYDMQIKENNNCSPPKESGGREPTTTGQRVTDSQNNNSGADQTASNQTNHSSGVKRHQSCENSSNECNGNESPLNHMFSRCEDTIVFKLSNFSLNNHINDKLVEKRNSMNKESKCDKAIDESLEDSSGLTGVTGVQQKSESKPAVDTTVSSHDDNAECDDSTSITNDLNHITDSNDDHLNDHLCQNYSHDTTDCQHVQVLDNNRLITQQKEGSQHLTLDIGGDGLIMSQTNSIDNGSSICSSSASCLLTNGYDTCDVYQNYPDSISNGVYSPPHSAFSDVHSEVSFPDFPVDHLALLLLKAKSLWL